MVTMSDSMVATLWTTAPALLTASIVILAAWVLLNAHAGGASRLAQLESTVQQQAHELTRLQTPLRMDKLLPHQVEQLCSHIERVDMQLAELSTQVQADDQALALLKRLSGIIADLRAQLQVSIQNSAQLSQHTSDLQTLKAKVDSRSDHDTKLQQHSIALDQLKVQLDSRAERQVDMPRQASILEDLKAQLSRSNDVSVELMFSRTSLEEARALMTQALTSQPHHVPAAGDSLVDAQSSQHKAGYWVKPKPPQPSPKPAQMRRRASVTFPAAAWESAERNYTAPNHELNADLTLAESTHSVSELGGSGAEGVPKTASLSRRASGAMTSPFASALYQVASDLKRQLEAAEGGTTRGSRRQSLLQDKDSASGASHSELDFALGGLPICPSLTRKRRPVRQASTPLRSHPAHSPSPGRARRLSDSRLSRDSSMALSSPADTALNIPTVVQHSEKEEASDRMPVMKPATRLLKALSGAKGLMPSRSRK